MSECPICKSGVKPKKVYLIPIKQNGIFTTGVFKIVEGSQMYNDCMKNYGALPTSITID